MRPPADAIAAVKSLLYEHAKLHREEPPNYTPMTRVDALLLEAWRKASRDPDDHAGKWMIYGAPAGIIHQPVDPGIFPDVSAPAEMDPNELQFDIATFNNYPGVESHQSTEPEMLNHIEKGHVSAFDSERELADHLGAQPIMSKLGIIEKTRNGITSARTILDTKESLISTSRQKRSASSCPSYLTR